MNVRATAAVLALLFTTTTGVLAWAEKPSTTLRVAVVLEAQADNAAKEQRLLEGLENGLVFRLEQDIGQVLKLRKAPIPPTTLEGIVARLSDRETTPSRRRGGASRWWRARTSTSMPMPGASGGRRRNGGSSRGAPAD